MKKGILLIFTFIFVGLFIGFLGCKKDAQTNPAVNSSDTVYLGLDTLLSDNMSDDEYQILLQCEDTVNYPLDSLVLGDGEHITYYLKSSIPSKNQVNGNRQTGVLGGTLGGSIAQTNIANLKSFIKKLTNEAAMLSLPMEYAMNDVGQNRPAPKQSKIAYVEGPLQITVNGVKQDVSEGKDYTIRSKTPVCTDWLHGLDCSGYVNYMFANAGATFPPEPPGVKGVNGAEWYRRVKNIQAAVYPQLGNGSVNMYEVVDMPDIAPANMRAGDIFYTILNKAPSSHHIGLIGQAGASATTFLFHSWGNSNVEKCTFDESPDAGPIAWSFAKTTPTQLARTGNTVTMNVVRIRYIAELIIISGVTNSAAGASNQLVVQVVSSDNLPVKGINVNFTAQGGSVTSALPTDANGKTSATWTLGNSSGQETCTAAVISPIDNLTALDQVTFNSSDPIQVNPDGCPVTFTFGLPPSNSLLLANPYFTYAFSNPGYSMLAAMTEPYTTCNGQTANEPTSFSFHLSRGVTETASALWIYAACGSGGAPADTLKFNKTYVCPP